MRGDPIVVPERMVYAGEEYQHYKGDWYRVVCTAEHSNTGEMMAVYEPMYDNPDWPYFTRPVNEFFDIVEWQGKSLQRFTKRESPH
jgi:hypothetical protein